MEVVDSLKGIAALLAIMALLSLVELLIPLRARGVWNRQHLVPNLTLTLISFTMGLVLNALLLLGLLWFEAMGRGLFNAWAVPPLVAFAGGILALDLAWYVTHVSLHKSATLWRFHNVHHSDPALDVTTTVRQHPGEGLIRYAFLAVFGFGFGVSPAAFAVYRVWSVVNGMFEHANISLPQWLDTAISFVVVSPNMHKVHHSRDYRFAGRNYSNIFSVWDRLGRTFTPSHHGCDINYGLDGEDGEHQQTTGALLHAPFRRDWRGGVAPGDGALLPP
jgi:sterol desaturase/sphingolipid hydroxylase (fatty acid hydroxylase superfamily)